VGIFIETFSGFLEFLRDSSGVGWQGDGDIATIPVRSSATWQRGNCFPLNARRFKLIHRFEFQKTTMTIDTQKLRN